MNFGGLILGWFLAFAGQSSTTAHIQPPCGRPPAAGVNTSAREACLGDENVRLAEAAPTGNAQRRSLLETAIQHYRNARGHTPDFELKERVLEAIVRLYDPAHLNKPVLMDHAWQELVALRMGLIQ